MWQFDFRSLQEEQTNVGTENKGQILAKNGGIIASWQNCTWQVSTVAAESSSQKEFIVLSNPNIIFCFVLVRLVKYKSLNWTQRRFSVYFTDPIPFRSICPKWEGERENKFWDS